MSHDTIFALASGAGRAAVAVIRLSGPNAERAVITLVGCLPAPRTATLARLRDPASGTPLDRALVLWFPAPASFTGESAAEFQVHGGRAVVAAVLASLGRIAGCRPALPGEFTRRAFLNQKLDLPAVEGLADLIDAQTEAQRSQALQQLDGALGRWAEAQRTVLVRGLAAAESAIDFADEPDVGGDFETEVFRCVTGLAQAIAAELAAATVAARVREGFVVALTGPPNVGKSTLLNMLARREAAIVSPHAGTTRDPVEVVLDVAGHLITIIDTAGLRDTDDPIEQEGVRRARLRAESADLVLWLFEARTPLPPDPALKARQVRMVATKLDLATETVPAADYAISAQTGQGFEALVDGLREMVERDRSIGDAGVVTRLRHRLALEQALKALTTIMDPPRPGLEIVADQLRFAAHHLDSLVGRIESDEVLGEIFSRFCIGK